MPAHRSVWATVLVILITAAVAVADPTPAPAAPTTEVVTVENCTCSNNCTTHYPVSGSCVPDPLNPAYQSRTITCMDQIQQCAQLVNFLDSSCSIFKSTYTAVCGQCQKFNDNPMYYAIAHCDALTQTVSWDINCGVGCTGCLVKNAYVHPFASCSTGLGGQGSTYNQGISSCDAVTVSVYQGTACAANNAVVLDQFVTGQYSCTFGEYFACAPKNPTPLPPLGTQQVTIQHCPFSQTGTSNDLACKNCPSFSLPTQSCQPAPQFLQNLGILSHTVNCASPVSMCADLVIHNSSQCNNFIGRSTPVCSSCIIIGNDIDYSYVNCDTTSQAVTLSKGCNADCSVCQQENYVTHEYLQCDVGFINTTSVYNRGLFPCNTVSFAHYNSTNCAPNSLVHTEIASEGICEFDRMATCLARLVVVQNCSNDADTQMVQEGQCVPDAFGKFREYTCQSHVKNCAQLVRFADAACTKFEGVVTAVCGACMRVLNPFTQNEEYQQIVCNLANQQVSINGRCNQNCSLCTTIGERVNPINQCSHGMYQDFIYNEGISECDAVQVAVYSNNSCASGSLIANWTVGQNQCQWDEYIQCTADALPQAPPGNQVNVKVCMDNTCGSGCSTTQMTAGGCQENFLGRPGGHMFSCDTKESWCADLTVHTGQNCQFFSGAFHPVCGSCSQWFNESDPYGFSYVQCDPEHPNITISTGCDRTCTKCANPNAIVHGYLDCSPDDLHPNWSVLNRGIIPCPTLTVTEFSDAGCAAGTQIAEWPIATSFCDMGTQISCGLETIGIQNCSACLTNASLCNKSLVSAGSCLPDPLTTLPSPGTRQISCQGEWEQCVHLAMFSDTSCSVYSASMMAVCGQCNQLVYYANGVKVIEYAMVTCNSVFNWFQIDRNCSSDCSMCSASETTIFTDQCNLMVAWGSLYAQGVQSCDVVQIQQFAGTSCQGQPYATYMVGQHQCSFDEYYECSARPLPQYKTYNGKVIWRECGFDDVACMNCTVTEMGSGSCMRKPMGGSHAVTCGGSHTCANLVMHRNSTCASYLGDHTPVCGSCFQMMHESNWTSVKCDLQSQAVTFGRDCSQNCAVCATYETHPYMECDVLNHSMLNDMSVFNRGLMPCDTAYVQEYSTIDCAAGTMVGSFHAPLSTCQFGNSIQCVPHIVTIESCKEPENLPMQFLEGSCQPDPINPQMNRRYECINYAATCTTLLRYNGNSGCQATPPAANGTGGRIMIAAVCNSCIQQNNLSTGIPEWIYIRCAANGLQTVQIDTGCNPGCLQCAHRNQFTHNFMQCSTVPGGSVFNQGVHPCSAVQVNVYDNPSCTGYTTFSYLAGQRDCGEFDHIYAYCDANPIGVPPPNGQIVVSQCPSNSTDRFMVEGDCTTGCSSYIVSDGACAPAPPGETRFQSHRITCNSYSDAMCADLVLYNASGWVSTGPTCSSQFFMGIHTPVCGSCYMFPQETSFTSIDCNAGVIKKNCNADCSVCTGVFLSIEQNICTDGIHPGIYLLNRGYFQCSTVQFTHFSSSDCAAGTSIGFFQAAQGICEFDHRFQCSANVVTVENCTCPSCAPQISAEGQCVKDNFGYYRQYECLNQDQLCGNMVMFNSEGCNTSDYIDGMTVVCDSCFKSTNPMTNEVQYVQVACNTTTQDVIFTNGCSDGTCDGCTGNQSVHSFNQCSIDHFGNHVFNGGIGPCDAISVQVYNDATCVSDPIDQWVGSQHFCAFHEYISCSAAPSVTPAAANMNAAEFYTCPRTDVGCIDCSASLEVSGACNPIPLVGNYHTISCDEASATCVDFSLHNNTQCADAYLGQHSPICGSCARWFNQPDFTYVQCDSFSQNVTVSFNCDSQCGNCGSSVVHPFARCSTLLTDPSKSLLNRGLMSCSTITISEFTSSTCDASQATGVYKVAEGLCQFGHKIQCVNVATPPVPQQKGSSPSVGVAVGVTAGVLIAIFAAVLGVMKYRNRRVYRSVDPQWNAMNEQHPTSPSNIQGAYGAVNE